MKRREWFSVGVPAIVGMLLLAAGCGDDDDHYCSAAAAEYDAGVALAWFDLQLKLVKETQGFSPPVASRAFAYSGLTLYETVVGGMPGYQSLAGQLNGMPANLTPGQGYHWPSAANRAMAVMTRLLFPPASAENQREIDELESELEAEFASRPSEVIDRSQSHGEAVADGIFAWSRTDGGDEGYLRNFPSDYIPPVGSGVWVPTPPGFQSAMQPYWGDNRTFVVSSGAECDPGPPIPYSLEPDSECYIEAEEVYDTWQTLTDEEVEIASFWSDDPGQTATPPGHSISILTQVLREKDATLDVAAEAYAKLGMAVADAFISCWWSKFEYNVMRPVTYNQVVFDPEWMPLLNTPPFPEYTSGHSAQSGAMAQVLTDLFGPMAFTDHTHDMRGMRPREFSSFFDAADEAAISRLYGGIHYRAAIELGLEQGKCVGQRVSALDFQM